MMSLASQLQAVNLKKIEPKESTNTNNNNVPEQKIKKILVNNRQNEIFTIKKKTDNNEKKVKLNVKKDEEKENHILKIKEQLKKNTMARSTADIKSTKKNEAKPEVTGFKNIKEMIEANIKKQQRVMSQTAIRGGDKKKVPGK